MGDAYAPDGAQAGVTPGQVDGVVEGAVLGCGSVEGNRRQDVSCRAFQPRGRSHSRRLRCLASTAVTALPVASVRAVSEKLGVKSKRVVDMCVHV